VAEHVHYQAEALHELGFRVDAVVTKDFLGGRSSKYRKLDILATPETSGNRSVRGVRSIACYRNNLARTSDHCLATGCRLVLLESFAEYAAPFWVGKLKRLKAQGVCVGANLHDPVRDYQIGPKWWHNWSVRSAYNPLSFVLVHQRVPREANIPAHVECHEVPVGVYRTNSVETTKKHARHALDIPLASRVYLAFGFIRDNKNLDLFIEAMCDQDDVFLVVAGRPQSARDKPVQHYQDLARRIGVASRVHFETEFIPDEKIPLYFAASDVVLLTYSEEFRSQSGVLNIAANYQKSVLASGGPSPLQDCVKRFALGRFVTPNCVDSLRVALREPDVPPPTALWDDYFEYASWTNNVVPLVKTLKTMDCGL